MEYTCKEVKEKLKDDGLGEEKIDSLLNAIVVEYSNLERNGFCRMEGNKLEIPDWNRFLFSIKAYDSACGPYTKEDIEGMI